MYLLFDRQKVLLIQSIGFVDADTDGGLEQDLASRRYRALLPDDDYDSDEL